MTECSCDEVCELGYWPDQFQGATRELMVFTKSAKRYFDLDAVREPHKPHGGNYRSSSKSGKQGYSGFSRDVPHRVENPSGAPPLDWWQIPSPKLQPISPYEGPPMTATMYIGDVLDVLGKLPENSVDLVLSSPPFLALRSYLPADHPDKEKEGGSQSTPGEYIDWLLDVVEACDRVLAPHGSLCFELGDTYAGNAPGDQYQATAAWHDGRAQPEHQRKVRFKESFQGWPLAKSLSLIPESFRFAMVYGFNPFTGRQTERWRLRNVIRWVRPNPPVGALGDKFRPATSELMVFCKSGKRYFDLDAVREPNARVDETPRVGRNAIGRIAGSGGDTTNPLGPDKRIQQNPAGAPPLDWWEISLLDEEAKPYGPKTEATKYSERVERELARNSPGWQRKTINERGDKGQRNFERSPAGAPPLDWWNIPLLEGEEPTKLEPRQTGGRYHAKNDGRRIPGTGDRGGSTFEAHELGAPPLDWWNIPPGGYEGAHYAVWPPELLIKPIKAMCPEQVCRTCGEARRRILNDRFMWDRQPALAAHIREQRVAAGYSLGDVDNWFGFKDGAAHWERTDKSGANIPTPEVWPVLKERLGLSAEFDDMINGGNLAEYIGLGPNGRVNKTESPYQTRRADGLIRPAPTFTDCGHDDYRNGVVLDPFVGSGTTLAVASGHGRNAIGIDLDERNYSLALERVGPLVLQRGEVAA